MTNNKKVYVEGQDNLITDMFMKEGWTIVFDLFSADLLCLEGGYDVTPALYGEKNTHSTNNTKKDISSLGLITAAKMLNIPIVGICRGAQILNVSMGGKMIQHVDGHSKTHKILVDGDEFEVKCGHHQAMVPHDSLTTRWDASDGVPEIVTYVGAICFQPHPEWTPMGHESRELFFDLIADNFDLD